MCKLLIITGALRKESVERVLEATRREFSKTERDGFGFIAVASKQFARGRYFAPDSFDEEHQLPANTQVLVVHGRTATSARHLANVQPFMHGSEALAHNGVVSWIGDEADRPVEDCDSEQFFSWLQAHSWDEAIEAFTGWGAIAHVDVSTGILTVARDRAMLYIAKRQHSAGWIMATKSEHIQAVCAAADIKLQQRPLLVPDKKILVFDRRGAVTSALDWDGFGTRQLTYLDSLSWGNSDDSDDDSVVVEAEAEAAEAKPKQKKQKPKRDWRRCFRRVRQKKNKSQQLFTI